MYEAIGRSGRSHFGGKAWEMEHAFAKRVQVRSLWVCLVEGWWVFLGLERLRVVDG